MATIATIDLHAYARAAGAGPRAARLAVDEDAASEAAGELRVRGEACGGECRRRKRRRGGDGGGGRKVFVARSARRLRRHGGTADGAADTDTEGGGAPLAAFANEAPLPKVRVRSTRSTRAPRAAGERRPRRALWPNGRRRPRRERRRRRRGRLVSCGSATATRRCGCACGPCAARWWRSTRARAPATRRCAPRLPPRRRALSRSASREPGARRRRRHARRGARCDAVAVPFHLLLPRLPRGLEHRAQIDVGAPSHAQVEPQVTDRRATASAMTAATSERGYRR